MILDDRVLKFEEEEQHEALKVVLANAALHLCFHDSFPKDVLVMGDNWYMLVPIDYSIQNSSDIDEQMRYNIRAQIKDKYFTGKRCNPISHIIERLKNDIQNEELALLLFSEDRVREAENLWPVKEEFTGWYVAHYDNKKISVFPYARNTFETNPIEVTPNMPHG